MLPALGYPNYQLPFFLFIDEREGSALGVLTPKRGDDDCPKGYHPVAQGSPTCLKAIPVTLSL